MARSLEGQRKMKDELFLTFPHYYGPSLADFATALVYNGMLATPTIPLTDASYAAYDKVAKAANTGKLGAVFRLVSSSFGKHVRMWTSTRQELEPVGSHLKVLQFEYGASPVHFENLFELTPEVRSAIADAVRDPLFLQTAAVEFMWRVHAYLDACQGNEQEVVRLLEDRATSLGHEILLLPDSFMNRFLITSPLPGVDRILPKKILSPVTNSDTVMRLAGAMRLEASADLPPEESLARLVSFKLFTQLVGARLPRLVGRGAQQVATLLEKHADAAGSLRAKCMTEATELVVSSSPADKLEQRIRAAYSRMRPEATAMLELDSKASAQFLKHLSEDPFVWSSPAALIGLGALSSEMAACGAIALLGGLGATAMKARNAKSAALKNSPFALLYYIDRVRAP